MVGMIIQVSDPVVGQNIGGYTTIKDNISLNTAHFAGVSD